MILRLSNSAQRAALVPIALLVAVVLAYLSIQSARAEYFANMRTLKGFEHATQLEPGNARNWYLLGRYRQFSFEDPDGRQAIHAYMMAVSLDPRSAATWLGLGAAYESIGNFAQARDAYLRAKQAYPLSPEVSWQYGNFLLRRGELKSAFAEMRRAVECDPGLGVEAFSRSQRVEPDVEDILDRLLPPDRAVYVAVIKDQVDAGQTDIALQVWHRLVAIHPQMPLQDAFPLMGALRNSKRFGEAHRVWDQAVLAAGMADLQGPPGSVLWDGGFEAGVSGGGYSWFFPEAPQNVQISIDAQEKHSGNHSLRLTFDGKSIVTSTYICHYVPVSPATSYSLSTWMKTRAVTTDQGIRIQLRSVGGRDNSMAVTPELHGSEPWTRLEIPWSSARDAQEVQVCLVRFLSDQLENRIKGIVWVDDVALVPEAVEHSKP